MEGLLSTGPTLSSFVGNLQIDTVNIWFLFDKKRKQLNQTEIGNIFKDEGISASLPTKKWKFTKQALCKTQRAKTRLAW